MNDLSEQARSFLEQVRDGDGPTIEQRSALANKLSTRLGIAALSTTALATSATASATTAAVVGSSVTGVVVKSLVAVLVVGAVTTASVLAVKSSPREAAKPAQIPTPNASTQQPSTAPAVRPAPRVADAHASTLSVVVADAATPIAVAPDALEEETNEILRARELIKGSDPLRGLRALETQNARFPNGALREERASLRVLALCTLGRIDESREAAQEFAQRYPHSPLNSTVQQKCEEPTRLSHPKR